MSGDEGPGSRPRASASAEPGGSDSKPSVQLPGGAPVASLAADFAELGLSEPLLKAVAAKGYRTPSPIQLQ